MKRIGGLYDRICAYENLVIALWKAASGKRNRSEVRHFIANGEYELNRLASQLQAGQFQFGEYHQFTVRDTKSRVIHAPGFRDRVVHHAIINVAGPVFERGALQYSYACRKGCGQHKALRQAARWTRRDRWYAKIDVRKFYDSVAHPRLQALLYRRFRETRLLTLFDALLASYQTAPERGLPIGALTSQYLGNFYLDEFDRIIKATGCAPMYLRYMDDILVLGTERSVAQVRAEASGILHSLGLVMKHQGEWNRCEQGVPFLGFVIYPNRTRLNKNGRKRLRRKLRHASQLWNAGALDDLTYQSRLTSLMAHAGHADDVAWRRAVLSSQGGV